MKVLVRLILKYFRSDSSDFHCGVPKEQTHLSCGSLDYMKETYLGKKTKVNKTKQSRINVIKRCIRLASSSVICVSPLPRFLPSNCWVNVQPSEECCVHHNEAVYDQDQWAGDTEKLKGMSPLGMWAVVRLPAPAAGAESKTVKSPQSLRSPTDNNCCHVDLKFLTKGSHISSGGTMYLIFQSARSRCADSFD